MRNRGSPLWPPRTVQDFPATGVSMGSRLGTLTSRPLASGSYSDTQFLCWYYHEFPVDVLEYRKILLTFDISWIFLHFSSYLSIRSFAICRYRRWDFDSIAVKSCQVFLTQWRRMSVVLVMMAGPERTPALLLSLQSEEANYGVPFELVEALVPFP